MIPAALELKAKPAVHSSSFHTTPAGIECRQPRELDLKVITLITQQHPGCE